MLVQSFAMGNIHYLYHPVIFLTSGFSSTSQFSKLSNNFRHLSAIYMYGPFEIWVKKRHELECPMRIKKAYP